jgi:hypothetical protein
MKEMLIMTELLRNALTDAPALRSVEGTAGVTHQSMIKFLRGASLRLDIADRLAARFGIEYRKKGR